MIRAAEEFEASVSAPFAKRDARLVAIELAAAGATRAEAEARLAARFPGADVPSLLDDVFGRTTPSGHPSWRGDGG
jgi:hypothetical protein